MREKRGYLICFLTLYIVDQFTEEFLIYITLFALGALSVFALIDFIYIIRKK
jgi:hypothetical protein